MNILEFAKREFEKQYDCTMTVSVNKPEKVGSVTKSKWTAVIRNHPCRISQKQLSPVSDGKGFRYMMTVQCMFASFIALGDLGLLYH